MSQKIYDESEWNEKPTLIAYLFRIREWDSDTGPYAFTSLPPTSLRKPTSHRKPTSLFVLRHWVGLDHSTFNASISTSFWF